MIISLVVFLSCDNEQGLYENNFRLFQETPAWDLAQLVEDQKINKIRKIVKKNRIDVDFQEPKFGNTLLMLAVKNEKYKSCEALLELGADPNLANNHSGSSAIIDAAEVGEQTRFLNLLISYGGEPSFVELGERMPGINNRRTPSGAHIHACSFSYVC